MMNIWTQHHIQIYTDTGTCKYIVLIYRLHSRAYLMFSVKYAHTNTHFQYSRSMWLYWMCIFDCVCVCVCVSCFWFKTIRYLNPAVRTETWSKTFDPRCIETTKSRFLREEAINVLFFSPRPDEPTVAAKSKQTSKPQDVIHIHFIHIAEGNMRLHMGNLEFAALSAGGTSLHRYSVIQHFHFLSLKADMELYRPSGTRPIHSEQTPHLQHTHFHPGDFPVVFSVGITQAISLGNVPLQKPRPKRGSFAFLLWKQTPRWEINLVAQLRGFFCAATKWLHVVFPPFIIAESSLKLIPSASNFAGRCECLSRKMQNRNNINAHSLFLLISSNGLNGTISVFPLEGSMAGMMPTAASANSPTAYTILDVDHNAYLFVGGIVGTVKVSVCPCVCVHREPVCLLFLILSHYYYFFPRKQM